MLDFNVAGCLDKQKKIYIYAVDVFYGQMSK